VKILNNTQIQLYTGINHLDKYDLVHRDLKGDNVLIDEFGRGLFCSWFEKR